MKIIIAIFCLLGSFNFASPVGPQLPEPIHLKLRFSQSPEINRLVKLKLTIKAPVVDLEISKIEFDNKLALDFSHSYNKFTGFLIKSGESKTIDFYVKQLSETQGFSTLQAAVSYKWPSLLLEAHYVKNNSNREILKQINSFEGLKTVDVSIDYYSHEIESVKDDISLYRGVVFLDSSNAKGLFYNEPWMQMIDVSKLKAKIDQFEEWLAILDAENFLDSGSHVSAAQLDDHFFNYYCLAIKEVGLKKPKELLKRLTMIVDSSKLNSQKSLSKSVVAILSLQANMYLKLKQSKKAFDIFKMIVSKAPNLYETRYAYYQMGYMLKNQPKRSKKLLKRSLRFNSGFTLAKQLLKNI